MADISPESLAHLTQLSNILHLFHHRNKNQHRHSLWWRHFSVFRKNLNRFLADCERLNTVPTTHLARTKKKTHDVRTRSSIEARITFWQDVAVAKWQRAFSQLVADGRFAVLGLVLMAALADVCKTVGITARLDEMGQEEVEKVLDRFAAEGWEEGENNDVRGVEDLGEVVTRPFLDEEVGTSMMDESTMMPAEIDAKTDDIKPGQRLAKAEKKGIKRTGSIENPAKKKKRKKGGDAIDDLFSGL